MTKKPKGAPLKEAVKEEEQPQLFLTEAPKKDEPRCGNCRHFSGKICDLVLPPYIRVTDRAWDRIVSADFVCSFHSE